MIDVKELRAKAEIGLPDGTVKLMIKPATIIELLDEIERTKREFDEINSTYIRLETEAFINIEALEAADKLANDLDSALLYPIHQDALASYRALRNPK